MNFIRRFIFSTDHKIIGIQFLLTSLIFFLLAGGLAMMMRPSQARSPRRNTTCS